MQLRAGLSELTAFIAIAEHRSFRAAARTLGVSPPALSHAVRNLEESLNVRLFNRSTRSVALTEAGEQLLRRVRPALADLEDGLNEVASVGDRPSGSIRISAAEAGARPLILHVLPSFLAAYPDIHVEIVVDTRLVDIVADGFDAGIRVFDDVPRDMIGKRLAQGRYAISRELWYMIRGKKQRTLRSSPALDSDCRGPYRDVERIPKVARQTHRVLFARIRQQVVQETLEPGTSVSVVARRHDMNANVVFEWKRLYPGRQAESCRASKLRRRHHPPGIIAGQP